MRLRSAKGAQDSLDGAESGVGAEDEAPDAVLRYERFVDACQVQRAPRLSRHRAPATLASVVRAGLVVDPLAGSGQGPERARSARMTADNRRPGSIGRAREG